MRATPLPGPSHDRRILTLSAGALMFVYAALIILAAACPVDPAPRGSGHYHHSPNHHGKAAHTLLCVWACQISSTTPLIALHQIIQPALVLIGAVGFSCLAGYSATRALVRSRAPPCASLDR
ncbi:MAG: hypothetical protein ACREJU_13210 [Nitrospiraceae bacterium]